MPVPKHKRRDTSVRIIAGQLKGRRIRVAGSEVRPTPDRVRETLFNWLAPIIEGSEGLDLFAGSGALGIEALSRGAARIVFVEQDRVASRSLKDTIAEFGCSDATVVVADARRYLLEPSQTFDLVFLDPPFDSPDLENLCTLLETRGWLNPGARIYMETSRRRGIPPLPDTWELQRQNAAGQVVYALAQREG